MIHKQIKVRKQEPWLCAFCPTPSSYIVSFTDPNNPGPPVPNNPGLRLPIRSIRACHDHVRAATLRLLHDSGFGEPLEPKPDTLSKP